MAFESPLSAIETARISYFSCTGKKILEVQILEPQSPALYIAEMPLGFQIRVG